MIKPTPGRIVWFYPATHDRPANGDPLAAILAAVIDDRTVNLTVCRQDGTTFPAQHVTLLQDGDELQVLGQEHAAWMPYQKGQAAKTEAAIANSPTLEPLQDKILELEKGIDDKINLLGRTLDPVITEIGQRLAALEQQPPASPAPSPPSARPDAGDATQQQST